VVGDLKLIHPKIQNSRHSISPDVLVFKGIAISQEERKYMASWRIEENHPAPPVVFEISSDATWKNDIERGEQQKPAIYERIGVKEYYAYDPFHERVWQGEPRRLLGWRYEESSKPIAIIPDERGWLWSEELDSWLGADGEYLRLYDRAGNLRLTNTEAAEARILELEAQLRRAQGKN
jgi:Uma2 family endonuclease